MAGSIPTIGLSLGDSSFLSHILMEWLEEDHCKPLHGLISSMVVHFIFTYLPHLQKAYNLFRERRFLRAFSRRYLFSPAIIEISQGRLMLVFGCTNIALARIAKFNRRKYQHLVKLPPSLLICQSDTISSLSQVGKLNLTLLNFWLVLIPVGSSSCVLTSG